MASHDTDLETEKKRHRPALFGIAAALVAAALFGILMIALPRLPADEQATPVPTEPAEAPAVEGAQ